MRDFDRPLEPVGIDDAKAIGAAMRERSLVPDLVLCSTGLRARQTWDAAGAELGTDVQRRDVDRLYDADAAGYLDIIQGTGSAGSMLLVGHNPMLEDLALALAREDCPQAARIRSAGFPTAGLAVIDFDAPAAEIGTGTGTISAFLTPTDL